MASVRSSMTLLLVLAAVALAAGGCPGRNEPQGPPPPPVKVARAEVGQAPIQIRTIGIAEAIAEVEIRAQVSGELIGIDFAEGDAVEPGDPLFRIDPRPFEDALANAEAALRRSKAEARLAETEARRFEALLQRGATSKQQADQRRATAAAARATVAANEALVRDAETRLGFTRIRAPIRGRTGSLRVHVGDPIQPGDPEGMVSLRQISPIYVAFSVSGDRLPAIRGADGNGELEVLASPRGASDQIHRGELSFVDNAIDPETGMILLKGTFPNTDELLWPGLYVDLTLILGVREDAILVPAAAVQSGQEGPYVFVIDDSRVAHPLPVAPGEQFGDRIVIEEGLRGGELVVTDGHLRLAPGIEVTIQGDEREAAPPDSEPKPESGATPPEAAPGAEPGGPPARAPAAPDAPPAQPGTASPRVP